MVGETRRPHFLALYVDRFFTRSSVVKTTSIKREKAWLYWEGLGEKSGKIAVQDDCWKKVELLEKWIIGKNSGGCFLPGLLSSSSSLLWKELACPHCLHPQVSTDLIFLGSLAVTLSSEIGE